MAMESPLLKREDELQDTLLSLRSALQRIFDRLPRCKPSAACGWALKLLEKRKYDKLKEMLVKKCGKTETGFCDVDDVLGFLDGLFRFANAPFYTPADSILALVTRIIYSEKKTQTIY